MRTARLLTTLLCVVVGASAGSLSARAGAAVPASFFGMISEEATAARGAERERLLNLVDGTGARTIRQALEWKYIETAPGVYYWRDYDDWMRSVLARGYTVLPVLVNPPNFRSSKPGADPELGTYPPKSNNDFAAFAAAAARHYGPGGTFWTQNPSLRVNPVRAWQVWNEPNIRFYWPDGANPAAYVSMLRTVGSAIKSVDSGAEILTAGLPESPGAGHMRLADFVNGMYRAGGKGAFDTLAVHPYSSSGDGSVAMVDMVRKLMNDHGDATANTWVTEIGWADKGPVYPFNVGPAAQAENIRRLFTSLVSQKDRLRLRGIVYWNLKDAPPYANRPDTWSQHTGLYDVNEQPKPARDAYITTVRTLVSG